jgi:hypothetical protein
MHARVLNHNATPVIPHRRLNGAPDHFWIGRIGAKFANLSDAAGSPTFARRCLLKWHQLRIHGLAAQTRTVSGGDFGRSKRQLSRDLKYIAQTLLKLSFLRSR